MKTNIIIFEKERTFLHLKNPQIHEFDEMSFGNILFISAQSV